MEILEEVDFYQKYLDLKKAKGFGWKTFGSLLNMKDDAIRMAFTKRSLKDYEIEIIEKNFDGNQSGPIPVLSKNHISLDNDLINRPEELALLAGYLYKKRNEFDKDSIITVFFDKLRLEGENSFIQKLLDSVKGNNDEKVKVLRDAIANIKLASEND